MEKKKIQKLSSSDVLRICSQQAILDFTQCVKELVENSLDASSTQLEVRIKRYGLDGIEIADNGTGIPESQFSNLTSRHSTSKIEKFEDLERVRSFGFRGEALSSICALGRLHLITATDGPIGFKVVYGTLGDVVEKIPHPRQKGTTIIVSNLFHDMPVRLKEFERSCKREYYKCVQMLQEYALISRNIRFNVIHIVNGDRNNVFSTQGGDDIGQNIVEILGTQLFKQMFPIDIQFQLFDTKQVAGRENENQEIDVEIRGYISKPLQSHGRSSLDKQYFYLHGRPCNIPKLTRKINEVYKGFNPNQNPVFVLELSLPDGTFDVNVSPDKRTILIHHESEIIANIESELNELFEPYRGTFELNQTPQVEQGSKPSLIQPSLSTFAKSFARPSANNNNNNSNVKVGLKENLSLEAYKISKKPLPDVEHSRKVSEVTLKSASPDVSESETSSFDGDQTDAEDLERTEIIAANVQSLKRQLSQSPPHLAVQSTTSAEAVNTTKSRKIDRPRTANTITSAKCFEFDFEKVKKSLKIMKQKHLSSQESSKIEPHPIEDAEAETRLQRRVKKGEFKNMKIIGQFNKGFIVAALEEVVDGVRKVVDLFVVDQHASDEIYLFHRYQEQVMVETQRLIIPHEISVDNLHLVMEHKTWFRKNGFIIDECVSSSTGKPSIRVQSVPVLYGKVLGIADFEELCCSLNESSAGIEYKRPTRIRALFASKACRTAYMIGDSLNKNEMRTIVSHLADIKNPIVLTEDLQ